MKRRWLALDRLRALAVVMMVQGHTFSGLMRDGEMPGGWGQLHGIIHGLTAPMFLFGAGLAFGITTYPAYEKHHADRGALKKRMRRYLMLIAIGYALQVPGASLATALSRTGEAAVPMFRVGPLHLIAITLGLAQLMVRFVRSPRGHAHAMLALSFLVLGVTPMVWQSEVSSRIGPFLGAWLDNHYGSFFSLFPWAGFALLGVASGGIMVFRGTILPGYVFAIIGACLSGVCYLVYRFELVPIDPQWFWVTSPLYMAFRLGLVLVVLGLLHKPSDVSPDKQRAFAGSIPAAMAQHSLVAYVVHLLVIYGTPLTPNLNYITKRNLDLSQALLAFVAIMGVTLGITVAWDYLSREKRLAFRWMQAALTITCISLFLR